MITTDQLEVLIRSVPQYFLFGGLAFYILAWMEKKPKLGLYAELFLITIGLTALVVLLSGMIPSPYTDGLVEVHIKMVIKVLIMLVIMGVLASASLALRLIKKRYSRILIFVVFALAIITFFQTTSMSKVKFELNKPETIQGEK